MTAPESILVPKGRLDDTIAELRSAIARADRAEANNAKACAALGFIFKHTAKNTLPNVTAKAELRRQE